MKDEGKRMKTRFAVAGASRTGNPLASTGRPMTFPCQGDITGSCGKQEGITMNVEMEGGGLRDSYVMPYVMEGRVRGMRARGSFDNSK